MFGNLRRSALTAGLVLAVAAFPVVPVEAQSPSLPQAPGATRTGIPPYSPLFVPGSPGLAQYGPVVVTSPNTAFRPFTTYNSLRAGPSVYLPSPFTPPPIYSPPRFYKPVIVTYP
jgi:hypothetical protein